MCAYPSRLRRGKLGERQLGDRQLVLDRARLLLRDLGLEQIAREALRFMPTFEGGREDLVPRVWLRQPALTEYLLLSKRTRQVFDTEAGSAWKPSNRPR
jgi:hypothetical protein